MNSQENEKGEENENGGNPEIKKQEEGSKWVWGDEEPGYKKRKILPEEDLGTFSSLRKLLEAKDKTDAERLKKQIEESE